MTEQKTVTNSAFLQELARGADRGQWMMVNAFSGDPHKNTAWGGQPYSQQVPVDSWDQLNTYFSVASLTPDSSGEIHRRLSQFARLLAVVVDDAETGDMMASPSWVLETSPGKSQVGFLLDGSDTDAADPVLVRHLVTRLVSKGLLKGDASGNNAVRWVRLPVGENQKPRDTGVHAHVMRHWAPQVRYTLADACAALGIDLDEVREEAVARPNARSGLTPDGSFEARLHSLTQNVIAGENLHDSINQLAAMKVASGTAGGAVVGELRMLMQMCRAPRDDRWQARFEDIPRAVSTAQEKYGTPVIRAQAPEADEPQPQQDTGLPDNLRRPGGVIDVFADWCTATAPRQQPDLALLFGLSLCATALGRHVAGETGLRTNLYLVGVARTGAGKEHGRKRLAHALDAAGLGHLMGGDEIASSAGLVSRLEAEPSTVIMSDEYGLELQSVRSRNASSHKAGIIALQLKLFGLADGTYRGSEYADKKARKQTPIPYPCLNIAATTTAETLWPALVGADVTSGLLNRLLFVFAADDLPQRRRAAVTEPPEELVDWLRAASTLSGDGNLEGVTGCDPAVARLSPAAVLQIDSLQQWADAQIVRARDKGLDALYTRVAEYAERLAIVAACAGLEAADLQAAGDAKEIEVGVEACGWACAFVRHLVAGLEARIGEHVGSTDFERDRNQLLAVIRRQGRKGLTLGEVHRWWRRWNALQPREHEALLRALTTSDEAVLVEFEAATNGKARRAYVAAEHAPAGNLDMG